MDISLTFSASFLGHLSREPGTPEPRKDLPFLTHFFKLTLCLISLELCALSLGPPFK